MPMLQALQSAVERGSLSLRPWSYGVLGHQQGLTLREREKEEVTPAPGSQNPNHGG